MLIEFKMKNFRSIRDEQILSLYAETPGDCHAENIAAPGGAMVNVLKSAGIYGANASGKSNVLRALSTFRSLILSSTDLKLDQDVPQYDPYMLDEVSRNEPIAFALEFFGPDELRYVYEVSFDRHEITHEELRYYPASQPALLFKRVRGDNRSTITLGKNLKGSQRRIDFLHNHLYLTRAANTESGPDLLKEVYRHLRDGFVIPFDDTTSRRPGHRTRQLQRSGSAGNQVINAFLRAVDTGIDAVGFRDVAERSGLTVPEGMPERFNSSLIEGYKEEVVAVHDVFRGKERIGREEFFFFEESAGTQTIYGLLGYMVDALLRGGILILDEIDRSMHPHLSELVIGLFNDPEANPLDAQLVFTTHDVTLMSSKRMRRDQIWFTEKDAYGATSLFALDEFDKKNVRNNSPFGKWYNDGRFGAIPRVDHVEVRAALDSLREIEKGEVD